VGQPELDTMLENESLRQLRQRVSVWCRLYPLSQQETEDYIIHRLSMAGGGHLDVFPPRVLKEIYRFSKGIPRLINLLCDRGLLAAYSASERQLNVKLIRKCVREVTGRTPQNGILAKLVSALAVFISVAAFGTLISTGAFSGVFNAEAKPVVKNPLIVKPAVAQPVAAQIVQPPPVAAPAAQTPKPPVAAPTAEAPKPPVAAPAAEAPKPAAAVPAQGSKAEAAYGMESRSAAVNTVLALWGAPSLAKEDESLALEKIAKARRMECLVGRMELNQLKTLNYPAVLEIAGDAGKTLYLPLVRLTGATFSTGANGELTVTTDWVEKHWSGKAYIFWRDFNGGPELLKKGDHGASVKWLQASMMKLGYIGDTKGVTGVYGAKTTRAIVKFQSENRIPIDGKASAVTMMFIINLLPEYKVPRLS
jgi:general secretion pathway protein A